MNKKLLSIIFIIGLISLAKAGAEGDGIACASAQAAAATAAGIA